jgi:steroid 5-alpha reductase family enzyme
MDLSDIILIGGFAVWLYMSAFYVLSLFKRDASLVDIGWGLGFVLLVWLFRLLQSDSVSAGFNVIALLVSIWGIRLAAHIYMRSAGQDEDWRYRSMRQRWGPNFWWRSYVQIFLLQGLLMLVIAAPILAAAHHIDSFDVDIWLWLGAAVWLLGFLFEAIGDWQLSRFIKEKKARRAEVKGPRFMTSGLWRYTRHPNYFGEVTLWWGLFVALLGLGDIWWAIISPVTITFLLLRISGVTMLEQKYADDPEFQAFKNTTSAFFPLPPKK